MQLSSPSAQTWKALKPPVRESSRSPIGQQAMPSSALERRTIRRLREGLALSPWEAKNSTWRKRWCGFPPYICRSPVKLQSAQVTCSMRRAPRPSAWGVSALPPRETTPRPVETTSFGRRRESREGIPERPETPPLPARFPESVQMAPAVWAGIRFVPALKNVLVVLQLPHPIASPVELGAVESEGE